MCPSQGDQFAYFSHGVKRHFDRLHTHFDHHSRLSAPSHTSLRGARPDRPTSEAATERVAAEAAAPQRPLPANRRGMRPPPRRRCVFEGLEGPATLTTGADESHREAWRGAGAGGGGRNARQLPEKGGASDRPGPNRRPGVLRAIFSTHAATVCFQLDARASGSSQQPRSSPA